MKLRPCLVCFFSLLNFYHSIFVIHHSSLITLNTTPVWHHHSIFFTLFVGLIPVTHCRVSFIFYFLFFTRKNTHQTYWKKKKKNQKRLKWKKEEEERNPEQTEVKERRRRKKRNPEQPTRRRKEKKSQKWSKVAIGYYLWVPYVCLISILLLN